jgi:hypothetical protein
MKFLQKITIDSKLHRSRGYQSYGDIGWRVRTRFWEDRKFREGVTKEVIVIGVRTLSNGKTEYEEEVGNMYTPITYFKALLVVESLSSKPFYIKHPDTISK